MVTMASAVDAQYERVLGAKLAVIEELRHDLNEEDVECPGVIVVGSQSAGKSSVLEHLTGLAFPRAQNTCTRVPTVVALQRSTAKPSILVSKTAQFVEGKKTERFDHPTEIGPTILKFQTDRLGGVPIKDTPVYVRYSRGVGPVMTLMDLPGITHNDEQHPNFDIHDATSAMVNKYIASENMIVLVVIPANDDFGNAEAIKMVKTLKAEQRCIGVVTKCDLVPTPEDASDIVQKMNMERQSDVHLDNGFVAVRSRAQNEMDKTQLEMDVKEEGLFTTHPTLRKLRKDQWGYATLTTKVVAMQSDLVDRWIPSVKKVLRLKRAAVQEELKALGQVPSDISERRALLGKVVAKTDRRIESLIRTLETSKPEMNIAARVHECSRTMGGMIKEGLPEFLSPEYGVDLRPRVKETLGYAMDNFLSDPIFRCEIHTHFFHSGNVENAGTTMVEKTFELMVYVVKTLLEDTPECSAWGRLQEFMDETWMRKMEEAKSGAQAHVATMLQAEAAQVWTVNPSYMATITAVKVQAQAIRDAAENEDGAARDARDEATRNLELDHGIAEGFIEKYAAAESENLDQALLELQLSLHCYAEAILVRLSDTIPIAIRYLLVLEPHECFSEIMHGCSDSKLERAFSENPANAKNRGRLERSNDRFDQALKKLASFN